MARSKMLVESLSEEDQVSSSEASIDTPSPTDSDDNDFFCPKGRNAQRVAARIGMDELSLSGVVFAFKIEALFFKSKLI